MRQILDNNATISSNVQKSHSVPNVNGHMQNQQHNRGRQQNSNKNNGNACPDHNEINEGTKKFSFNSADGDDPGMFLNSIIYKSHFAVRKVQTKKLVLGGFGNRGYLKVLTDTKLVLNEA